MWLTPQVQCPTPAANPGWLLLLLLLLIMIQLLLLLLLLLLTREQVT
jgi:hypothetical protein